MRRAVLSRSRHHLVAGLAAAVMMAGVDPAAGQAQDAPTPQQQRLRDRFAADLQGESRRADAAMGYAVVDLTSGDRFEEMGDGVFPAASTIKVAVLYELFRQVDAGTLSLEQTMALDPRHRVGGSGVLFELGTPVLSLRDYATLMIVLSDNTATNVVIDLVGMDPVNRTSAELGLTATRLRRRMMDLEAARRGDENVTSPRDLARLLEIIWLGKGLKQGSRDGLMAILKKRKSTPMVRGLPADIEVASKSGELDGVRADGGIVLAKARPYVFVAMLSYARNVGEAELAIERASRTAYEYFSRLGTGGSYGRAIP